MEIKNKDVKKLLINILLTFLTIFIIFLIIATGSYIANNIKKGNYIGADIEARNTISISASSELFVKPDLARINVSVKNEAKTAEKAMQENTKKMNSIIEKIKEHNIVEKDLKTTNFNLRPRYEWQEQNRLPSKRVLVGYETTQSLEIKIRDLDKIGTILETATKNGANQLGNINFEVEKRDEYEKQVREEAIEKAKAKAKTLADQLGVKLVDIKNFHENNLVAPQYYAKRDSMGIGGESSSTANIQAGENKIESKVTITYSIN